ncbi:hypothetical protein [Wenyingzhuangia fucanilytica]|nr:hypothetical protein [Wenyingzhuangia fucanilytica]
MKYIVILLTFTLLVGCIDSNDKTLQSNRPIADDTENWDDIVEEKIKRFGHRNWIVVVDEAYPLQSSLGITMLRSPLGQIETLKKVMSILNEQKHVKPIIYLDKEIDYVNENAAKGITAYRDSLMGIFDKSNLNKVMHDDIISMLSKTSDQFNVLVIKTNLNIPYTSVFFQLDCKYWNDVAEKQLRDKISESI